MLFENTPDITSDNRCPAETRQARLDYLARCYATCTPHEASPFDENGLYMRESDRALFGPRSKWTADMEAAEAAEAEAAEAAEAEFFTVDKLEFTDSDNAIDFADYLNS
jgi:hypothetical protein